MEEINQGRQGQDCRAQIYRTTEEKIRVLCSGGYSRKGGETGKLKACARDKKGEMAQSDGEVVQVKCMGENSDAHP